jgi:peptide chain release factor 3
MIDRRAATIAFDKSKTPVYLAESNWVLKIVKEAHPEVQFHDTSEHQFREEIAPVNPN